ncbi:MAG: L,D-transpeptidase family protein [Solirubrobacteraceae bacterium]|nr:L,D-transpeptidase family protein [Solirubrobacteraceae bacterium]
MRRWVLASGVLAVTLVASGGVVAGLHAATSGKIAEGVHVGDVDLGGLTPEQAKARLETDYLAPLQQPVVVERRGKRFQLSAKEAKVSADLDAAVGVAVKASESDAFSSAWRTVSGTKLDENIPVPVTYSDDAVLRFVDRVRRNIDRAPKEASVTFSKTQPILKGSQTGMAVDRPKLRKLVAAAVDEPTRQPMLVPVRTTKPKSTESALKKQHGTIITVDRTTNELRLFKNFKLAKKYRVAVGAQGHETPAGTYTINDKQVNPSWHVPLSDWAGSLAGTVVPPGPSNPIKARWMGFFDGAGIHGTSDRGSIGSPASHGCVRMLEEDVIDLYDRVPQGSTIHVV